MKLKKVFPVRNLKVTVKCITFLLLQTYPKALKEALSLMEVESFLGKSSLSKDIKKSVHTAGKG
jgi:hypothetical protein